jgi:hypothetical protein
MRRPLINQYPPLVKQIELSHPRFWNSDQNLSRKTVDCLVRVLENLEIDERKTMQAAKSQDGNIACLTTSKVFSHPPVTFSSGCSLEQAGVSKT